MRFSYFVDQTESIELRNFLFLRHFHGVLWQSKDNKNVDDVPLELDEDKRPTGKTNKRWRKSLDGSY